MKGNIRKFKDLLEETVIHQDLFSSEFAQLYRPLQELVIRCTFLNDSYYICSIKLKKTEMVAMNTEPGLMKA